MTPQERAAQLRNIAQAIRSRRVIALATTGTMVQISERVWGRGEMTDGSKLTYTGNGPYYGYKPPGLRKPTGRGKNGASIKGGYYANYEAFKAQQGRGNLPYELTGDMRKDWLGGVTPRPTENGPLQCVIVMDAANAKKVDGLTRQKGVFLKLNEEEIKEHNQRILDIYREILGQ